MDLQRTRGTLHAELCASDIFKLGIFGREESAHSNSRGSLSSFQQGKLVKFVQFDVPLICWVCRETSAKQFAERWA